MMLKEPKWARSTF